MVIGPITITIVQSESWSYKFGNGRGTITFRYNATQDNELTIPLLCRYIAATHLEMVVGLINYYTIVLYCNATGSELCVGHRLRLWNIYMYKD